MATRTQKATNRHTLHDVQGTGISTHGFTFQHMPRVSIEQIMQPTGEMGVATRISQTTVISPEQARLLARALVRAAHDAEHAQNKMLALVAAIDAEKRGEA